MPPRKAALYDDDDYEDYYDDDDYDDYDDKPDVKGKQKGSGLAQNLGASSKATTAPAPRSKGGAAPKVDFPAQPVQPAFDFSTPSPDDLAKQARQGAGAAPARVQHIADVSTSAASRANTASAARATPPVSPSNHHHHTAAPSTAEPASSAPAVAGHPVVPYRDPAQYVMEPAVRAALDKLDSAKPALHVVVLGHVDAGKSTLMGRLLHDLGYIDDNTVRKNMNEAQRAGKPSFGWAWAFDERSEERQRGVTIDISMRRIATQRFDVTLLDAPGHRDFIPNMITGASQADAALLIVDGAPGAFEAGFQPAAPGKHGGQTREHTHVARSLGIKQLAVAITKLDTCDYSETRFLEVRHALEPFLISVGFKQVHWLPVSAPVGENVSKPPQDPRLSAWWPEGHSLVDTLDNFEPIVRPLERPLRMVISEVFSRRGFGDVAVCGKVEAGALALGSRVLVLPSRATAVVKAVESQGEARPVSQAGENADVGLTGFKPDEVRVGSVLCHPEYPVHVATQIQARLLVVNINRPIIPGTAAILHMHSTSAPCKVSKLLAILDSKTGKVVKRGPACRMLLKDQAADVEITLASEVCMEAGNGSFVLERMVLRIGGVSVALGTLQKVCETTMTAIQ